MPKIVVKLKESHLSMFLITEGDYEIASDAEKGKPGFAGRSIAPDIPHRTAGKIRIQIVFEAEPDKIAYYKDEVFNDQTLHLYRGGEQELVPNKSRKSH
ncbi:unnamed protein product [Gemmata massiliana]|uniref:Uncharacterized protein n=1 Tax=Gemmata massiliana TaxID=1210884 RepID=A0A6P2DD12_9BACT|nr:hypothetical protein [Gemmata massiliana]VTR99207.1 unnamed protein product [Gemmata massiliana]